MSDYIVKILDSQYITHDVKRIVVERPKKYDFIPGQATDVSINLPEWKDNLHPFTFTGLKEWKHLEFTVKIYSNPKGVTHQLAKMHAGSELILHDVFGAIQYQGKGVFIAGGAGVTPFIAILRDLYKKKEIRGNKLIFSNKTASDIILEDEFTQMLRKDFIKVFTREHVIGFLDRRIDRDFLIENVPDFGVNFYVCGPDSFVKNINDLLLDLGAKTEALVFEQ
jgi:ferredoxin-NADP reductase